MEKKKMNKIITKENFLKLCEALEKDIINLEQFHILSNQESMYDAMVIVDIMSLEQVQNRNELFQKLLERTDVVGSLYHVLKDHPIYLTDLERQKYLFENFSSLSYHSIRLLENDALFQNETFRKLIIAIEKSYLGRELTSAIYRESEEHPELLDFPTLEKSLRKLLQLENIRAIDDYIRCMTIPSLQEDPSWYDRLVEFYNHATNLDFCCAYAFKRLEELEKMDTINEKINTVEGNTTNSGERDNKLKSFFKALPNIASDERKELWQEPYFSYLIDISFKENTRINEVKNLVASLIARGFTPNKIFSICNKISEIPTPNIRSIISDAFINGLLTEDNLNFLVGKSYDEVYSFIIQRALYLGNTEYIKDGKKYYGESFSKPFCQYVDEDTLTKEELLSIRDAIQEKESIFDGKSFMIDTRKLVPGEYNFEEKLVEREETYKEEVGKTPKKKSLFSIFRKGN